MGIKGFTSNKKRKAKSSKSNRWHRALKAEKKKQLPVGTLEIEDVELFSKEKLKNKLRNPKNNIKISGKKKRRLTKRLGHSVREKSQMDVEVDASNTRQKRKTQVDQETEGQDAWEDIEMSDTEEAGTSSAQPSTPSQTRRKKKRGGKKHKKKDTGTEKEDVEMDEDLISKIHLPL